MCEIFCGCICGEKYEEGSLCFLRLGRKNLVIIGSSSNYDDDHNDDFKTTIDLMIKTTALHVRHAF